MKKMIAIAFGLLLVASPALAQNESIELAMHVVVTDYYLYCETMQDWCPYDCTMIDNDGLESEIAPGGWGYMDVVFLAYNFDGISAVEFAVTGWPLTRGVPAPPAMSYCPVTATVFGDPWDGVGAASGFGMDIYPEIPCGGVYCFAFGVFNFYNLTAYLPMTLSYLPSTYTAPECCKVAGPAPDYITVCVHSTHGCTIGGPHWELVPYDDCNPGTTAVDETTWGGVKSMYR